MIKLWDVRIGATFLALLYIGVSLSSSGVFAVSWRDQSSASVISESHQTSTPDYNCHYFYQQYNIAGKDTPRNVCINTKDASFSIGFYQEDGRYHWVAGVVNDDTLYPFGGCEKADSCVYSPAYDTLFVKQHLINTIVYSLVAYQEVTKELQRSYNNYGQLSSYSVNYDSPDYVFQSDTGYAWPVMSLSLSSNGRWLAVELRDQGFGILDVQSMTMKHISTQALHYGYGMDPRAELAVSDTGEVVAVMGINVGAGVIENKPECGRMIKEIIDTSNTDMCKTYGLPINYYIDQYNYASNPYLNLDGGQLHIYASSYTGEIKRLVLRAPNYHLASVELVGMGDSFSSGDGEFLDTGYIDGTNTPFQKCHTSVNSYPFLVGQLVKIDEEMVKNIACSGATISDIVGNSSDYLGQGDRGGESGLALTLPELTTQQSYALENFTPGIVRQQDFIELYQPSMVTVGIGGNDAGLMGKLASCLMPGTCEWASSSEKRQQASDEILALSSKLSSVYQTLQSLSSKTQLFVVGYPLVVDDVEKCGSLGVLLDKTERAYVYQSIRLLNHVIESAADQAGASYINIEDVFKDRDLCAGSSSLMNLIRIGDDVAPLEKLLPALKVFGSESFHPTPEGHGVIAESIAQQMEDGTVTSHYEYPVSFWESAVPKPFTKLIASLLTLKNYSSVLESFRISLPRGSLLPNSLVRIELHSDPLVLSSEYVASDGSLDVEVFLPDTVEPGVHSLHVYADSFSEQPVELYQTVAVIGDETLPDVDEESTTNYGLLGTEDGDVTTRTEVTKLSINEGDINVLAQSTTATDDNQSTPSLATELVNSSSSESIVSDSTASAIETEQEVLGQKTTLNNENNNNNKQSDWTWLIVGLSAAFTVGALIVVYVRLL